MIAPKIMISMSRISLAGMVASVLVVVVLVHA